MRANLTASAPTELEELCVSGARAFEVALRLVVPGCARWARAWYVAALPASRRERGGKFLIAEDTSFGRRLVVWANDNPEVRFSDITSFIEAAIERAEGELASRRTSRGGR